MSRRLSYREALREGLREALAKDPRVFLMGEDVGSYGGSYAVSKGLLEEFGPERIRDTPLSELGFTGAGIGSALLSQLFVNLEALRVERVATVVARDNFALLEFFYRAGFGPSPRLGFLKRLG